VTTLPRFDARLYARNIVKSEARQVLKYVRYSVRFLEKREKIRATLSILEIYPFFPIPRDDDRKIRSIRTWIVFHCVLMQR